LEGQKVQMKLQIVELLKGVGGMFIETKYFDNGKTMARLHKCKSEPKIETSNSYDSYNIEEVGDLQEWIEDNLCIETDDIVDFVISLDCGKWTDMTNFC
jgi:hypothetical protein